MKNIQLFFLYLIGLVVSVSFLLIIRIEPTWQTTAADFYIHSVSVILILTVTYYWLREIRNENVREKISGAVIIVSALYLLGKLFISQSILRDALTFIGSWGIFILAVATIFFFYREDREFKKE